MKLDLDIKEDKKTKRSCARASVYMMKYMDGDISEKEAGRLNGHISTCASCKADFYMYDYIMDGMDDNAELTPAPEGFTESLMKALSALPSPRALATAAVDNIMYVVWSVFSLLFGAGFLMVIYKERIVEYLSGVPAFSGYVAAIMPVSERIYESVDGFFTVLGGAGGSVINFVANYKFLLLAAAAVLVGCQFLAAGRKTADEKS